jgi:hypothetical protein
MAYCTTCGKMIENGRLRCDEHMTEEDARAEKSQGISVTLLMDQVNKYVSQWLPVTKNLILHPYQGLRQSGSIGTPIFGIIFVLLSSLVKGLMVSSIMEELITRISRSFGMFGMGMFNDLDDLFENLFIKTVLFDLVQMLIIAMITLLVAKMIFKNNISLTQVINGVGVTQVYVFLGLIITFVLMNISPVIGIPALMVLLFLVPVILLAYLRENEFLKPTNVYAIPLIFFLVFLIDVILM